MTIAISAIDENAPIPRALVLELTCDGHHGLFQPEPARFAGSDFATLMAKARRVGWRQTSGDVGRWFLCPECAG